jgi:hypothetical protein
MTSYRVLPEHTSSSNRVIAGTPLSNPHLDLGLLVGNAGINTVNVDESSLLACNLGEERNCAMFLHVSHEKEGYDHRHPVEIVRDDGAISGRVFPSKNSVEDSPATSATEFGATALSNGQLVYRS